MALKFCMHTLWGKVSLRRWRINLVATRLQYNAASVCLQPHSCMLHLNLVNGPALDLVLVKLVEGSLVKGSVSCGHTHWHVWTALMPAASDSQYRTHAA